MKTYVRRPDSDTWHFAGNCHLLHEWEEAVVEEGERPEDGELCNECLSKERRGIALPIEATGGGTE